MPHTVSLTPGLKFLLTAIPKLIIPLLLVYASLRLLNEYTYFVYYSPTLVVLVLFLTLPLWWNIRALYTRFQQGREARRLGAELVPEVKGKLPGNIDLIWSNSFRKDLYLGDGWAKAIDTHGTTFSNTILGNQIIFTANPQNIKLVLATNFNTFEKGPQFNESMGSVLGVGVFNSDGEMWQFHRKLTRPFFARERVTDFGTFESKTSITLQRMQERFDSGQAIDFQDICSRFTLDSACEFLIGAPIHSLNDPLPLPPSYVVPRSREAEVETSSNRFARAFANAQISLAWRIRVGVVWPIFEIFKDRTAGDMRILREVIEPFIREEMKKRSTRKGNSIKEEDEEQYLLQHLLNSTQEMKLIVDEIVNIMLAGRDTTAGILTFAIYCLAMHPDALARLRKEIVSTVGMSRAPTSDDIHGMKFLRAVLNETLRLFPSVPFNARFSTRPTTLVDENGKKLYVPSNTRVVISSMLSQRHKPYWGEDAHLFDPDRFLDDRVRKYLTPNPFIFVPFSAGPRICIGQQFAYHEASYFIIRLLQRFDRIELAPECHLPKTRPPVSWKSSTDGTPRKSIEECVINSHLTMYVEGGLWVRMGRSASAEAV